MYMYTTCKHNKFTCISCWLDLKVSARWIISIWTGECERKWRPVLDCVGVCGLEAYHNLSLSMLLPHYCIVMLTQMWCVVIHIFQVYNHSACTSLGRATCKCEHRIMKCEYVVKLLYNNKCVSLLSVLISIKTYTKIKEKKNCLSAHKY